MLQETLLKVKSDRDFLEKQRSLNRFCKKFKTFSGKTIDDFSDEEFKEHTDIIKEFLGRHEKVQNFFYAAGSVKPDAIPINYI